MPRRSSPRRGSTRTSSPSPSRSWSGSTKKNSVPSHVRSEPQQPSLLKQAAATAAGVAAGSAVGHVAGSAITGMMSGGGGGHQVVSAQSRGGQDQQDRNSPCFWELSQFLRCADENDDLQLCQGFNEALRNCREKYNLRSV